MSAETSANKRSRLENHSWTRSRSSVIRVNHTWMIENFSLLPQKTGQCLWSSMFSDNQLERKIDWKLKLYPKGEVNKYHGFIGLYLCLTNPQPDLELLVTFKLTVMDKTLNVIAEASYTSTKYDCQRNRSWGSHNFLNRGQVTQSTLQGDELHVKCKVTYAIKETSLSGLLLLPSSGTGNWLEHFKQLFESKVLSDVVVQVKEERFDAHKIVLSARSSVFLAMFQSNLTETQTNTLKIEGIDPAVFKEVLRFMYTDQVGQLDELAEELLAAAERYMLNLLKSKCEAHLAGKITVENCAELLLLADLHSAAGLKMMVLDFFRSRAAAVAQMVNWQQLMESANSHLLRDISKALIPKTSVAFQ